MIGWMIWRLMWLLPRGGSWTWSRSVLVWRRSSTVLSGSTTSLKGNKPWSNVQATANIWNIWRVILDHAGKSATEYCIEEDRLNQKIYIRRHIQVNNNFDPHDLNYLSMFQDSHRQSYVPNIVLKPNHHNPSPPPNRSLVRPLPLGPMTLAPPAPGVRITGHDSITHQPSTFQPHIFRQLTVSCCLQSTRLHLTLLLFSLPTFSCCPKLQCTELMRDFLLHSTWTTELTNWGTGSVAEDSLSLLWTTNLKTFPRKGEILIGIFVFCSKIDNHEMM